MKTTNIKFLILVLTISYFTVFLSALKLKKSQYVKATEEGFTGDPKTLFDYKDFFAKSNLKENKTETDDPSQIHYGGWLLHDGILKDKRRSSTLKSVITKNPEVFKDKIILEIQPSTGWLSMLIAQAGAKHVYAFEMSDFADIAMKNVEENGLKDKITIIKSKVEEGELPVDKVDIIISEWMDALLFGENLVGSVIYARDKWLKEDGLMLPNRGQIKLAAIHSKRLADFVDFYDDVYGLKMPVIKQMIKSTNLFLDVDPQEIVSSEETIYEVDLYKMKPEDVNFASSYSLNFKKETQVSALVSWWIVEFNLPKKVAFSTHPKAGRSIWKQDVLFLEEPLKVAKGEKLNGSISVAATDNIFKRSNEVKASFHYNGKHGKYDKVQQYICDGSSMV